MSHDDHTARRADLDAPATQLVTDRDTYLGQGRHDVGRRIADDQVELFVSGDVASALQGEFRQHTSEFIALHDIGTRATLRLLSSLANASEAPVQRLTVRRQGHGTALAVLQFVEVALSDDSRVRVYSTDIESDGHTRQLLAPLLLAGSRLGVLMVGELPPHAMTSALTPLHDALARGPWPNRELLVVPVGSSTALAAQAAWLAGKSGVEIHVTPSASKPKQAWSYVGGAWNRSHGQGPGARAMQTVLERAVPRPAVPTTEAPTVPMGLDPAMAPPAPAVQHPHVTLSASLPAPAGAVWQAFADRCAGVKGHVACCVFDTHTLHSLAHSGSAASAARLAQQGATLLTQMHIAARALGLDAAQPEAVVTTGTHHLLLRHISGHAGVAVHMVLLASQTTPSQARADLDRIAPPP
jgi:hypothetical protein